jgi:hypothetical protein
VPAAESRAWLEGAVRLAGLAESGARGTEILAKLAAPGHLLLICAPSDVRQAAA